jgi:uncharacterized protein YbcV (DUF1398 family)
VNREVAEECTRLSDEEKATFPEIVKKLAQAGIELYYTDALTPSKTYYANNQAHTVSCHLKAKKEVADTFNPEKVVSAIRHIQSGQIQYQEFMKKIMEAGVVCYIVFIRGRKVIYFGKRGEEHIEEFPK